MPPLGLLLNTFPIYLYTRLTQGLGRNYGYIVRVVTVMVNRGASELPSEGTYSPRPLHVDSSLQQFLVEWDNLTEDYTYFGGSLILRVTNYELRLLATIRRS
jgi:hypothetical protein